MKKVIEAALITAAIILMTIGLFALAGCASTAPKIVDIPVPVTCVTPAPTEPVYPLANSNDGLWVRVQKLLIKEKLRDAYEQQLLAWGGKCHT